MLLSLTRFTKIFPENLFTDSLIVMRSVVVGETPVAPFAGLNDDTEGGVVSPGGGGGGAAEVTEIPTVKASVAVALVAKAVAENRK
jgi:hypothetical protein